MKKEILLYCYSHKMSFAETLHDDYKLAIKDHPEKFTALQAHMKENKWHPEDVLSEAFFERCTIERELTPLIKTGDLLYTYSFFGKDRIGSDLSELMNKYSEICFVYLFKEIGTKMTLNFKACHSDFNHEVQSKLINFLD